MPQDGKKQAFQVMKQPSLRFSPAIHLVPLILAVLTLWGGYLRFFSLGEQSLWIDEGFSIMHAKGILEHGYPLLPDGSIGWSYAPVHYLIAAGMALFGDIHFGARFFPALLGTALIPLFFYFNWRLTASRVQALMATVLLAFSTYEIAWSRQARMYIFLQFFTVASFHAFNRFVDTRRVSFLMASAFLTGLCPLVHRAGYLAVVFVLSAAVLETPRIRSVWWPWLRIRRNALAATCLLMATGSGVILATGTNANIVETIHGLNPAREYAYGMEYLKFACYQYGVMLVWAVIGAGISVCAFPRLLPLLAVAALFVYSISARTALFHYRYLMPVFHLTFLFSALGVHYVCGKICVVGVKWVRVLAMVFMVVLAGWSLSTYLHTLRPTAVYYLGSTEPQPPWRDAYAWIRGQSRLEGQSADTISTFPMFHDLYLGGGSKFYLPFSFSGQPASCQESPPYSTATVVDSLRSLRDLSAYVVLDDFGLRMLRNAEIRDYLKQRAPTRVFQSPQANWRVLVWRMDTPPGPASSARSAGKL